MYHSVIKPLQDELIRHVDLHRHIDLDATSIQPLRLSPRAWESVEQERAGWVLTNASFCLAENDASREGFAGGSGDPAAGGELGEDEGGDGVVGEEAAFAQDGFGGDAEGGAEADVFAQEVAGGEGGDLGEEGEEALGLRAFAAAGGPDEDEAGGAGEGVGGGGHGWPGRFGCGVGDWWWWW